MKKPLTALVAIAFAGLAVLTAVSAPAYASDGSAPPPPNAEQIQAEIDAIEVPAAREAAEELYAEILTDGRDVLSVQSATYQAEGEELAARGAPADCGFTVFASRKNQVIYNDTKTACASPFDQTTQRLVITGQNPYPPFNTNTVRDGSFVTYNSTIAQNTSSYACANANQTSWRIYSSGAISRGGSIYTAHAQDDSLTFQGCGW